MKKFGLLLAGGIAAIVLLSNLGSVVGLAISLFILYFAFKKFLKANKLFAKICWGLIGLVVLMASAANAPGILAIVAAYVLYLVYKNWNKSNSDSVVVESDDPFTNFEKQWSQLKNNY
ncbi:flagellar basal body rod protein [Neobacillus sp. LXY-4]|uniref:lmo0954 family membrane protein n=1 Tax=Neobacillus sp. LXY-4 TaxID=3379826 RepID=UPI003EE3AE9A